MAAMWRAKAATSRVPVGATWLNPGPPAGLGRDRRVSQSPVGSRPSEVVGEMVGGCGPEGEPAGHGCLP